MLGAHQLFRTSLRPTQPIRQGAVIPGDWQPKGNGVRTSRVQKRSAVQACLDLQPEAARVQV
eukprot:9763177-Alexandrium_andersonii.AAC.1